MRTIKFDTITVGVVDGETRIVDVRDMLDMMATFSYFEDEENLAMVISEISLGEKFFDLQTGFAGEILQKFSNYNMALAIVGDFGNVNSKSLRDFIRECNRGRQVFFVDDEQSALKRLQAV